MFMTDFATAYAELGSEQQEWLWTRYLKQFPKVESDAECHRIIAASLDRPEDTVKTYVFRWRQSTAFAYAEQRLRAGISMVEAQALVVSLEMSNAIAGVRERQKLINTPWDDMKERERTTKATAIRDSIKTVLEFVPPSAREETPADLMDEDLMRENLGDDDD